MHLLLLACSRSKAADEAPCPAMYRYTGPSYRILQKMARERGIPDQLHIRIVSGKFGLVRAEDPLPYYDQLISRERAEAAGAPHAVRALFEAPYESIFVNMGAEYRKLFDLSDPRIILPTGRIGEKNGKMKKWLESLY